VTVASRRQIAIGVLTAVIGALLLGAVSFTREQVIFRPEFDAHVQSDTAWKREQREMTLDILCGQQPANRRCR
jgi:hypothetical protein